MRGWAFSGHHAARGCRAPACVAIAPLPDTCRCSGKACQGGKPGREARAGHGRASRQLCSPGLGLPPSSLVGFQLRSLARKCQSPFRSGAQQGIETEILPSGFLSGGDVGTKPKNSPGKVGDSGKARAGGQGHGSAAASRRCSEALGSDNIHSRGTERPYRNDRSDPEMWVPAGPGVRDGDLLIVTAGKKALLEMIKRSHDVWKTILEQAVLGWPVHTRGSAVRAWPSSSASD